MRARWEDTLDTMLRVQWQTGNGGLPVLGICGLGETLGEDLFKEVAESLVHGAAIAFVQAAPIYVAPDIAEVWEAAHADFPPEVLLESDVLIDAGFALLPNPVALPEVDGAVIPPIAQALMWMTLPPAPDDEGELISGVHTWVLCQEGDLNLPTNDARPTGWACVWGGLQRWGAAPENGPDRSFQAFWRLMRQFVPQRELLPRAAARRAARAQIADDRLPTVMRLRRTSTNRSQPGAGTIDYTCQWPVRPHWRNQWYPSAGEHRAKLIPGYIKGPPDKPLRHAARVIEFIQ
jgi:hypothetical protein